MQQLTRYFDLQGQRVTALEDLQFLELAWLQDAIQELPPLLLNKFLSLARHQIMAAQYQPLAPPYPGQGASSGGGPALPESGL